MQEGSSPTISDVAEALLPGGVKGCTPDACKDLGNQMLQAGKVQDAIWLYTLGLDKRAGCHVLHSNRSAAYARLGEWVKALEDADACVLHNAGWARGHARRGAALEGMGRLDDAIAAHETVLTLDAGNAASPQAIEALKEKKRQKQGGEEDVYKTGSKSTNLVASTETGGGGDAGAEQPDPAKEAEERAKAKAEKIQRYKDRGNKAVQAGNFEDAIDNYSTAIELDPSNHVLYSNRAAAYCSVNQFQSALKDAQKCINLAPKFAKGYGRKAAALCGLNRRGEAVQSFHQGLSQCPEDGGLMKGLAELMPPEHKPRAGDEAQQAHKDDEQGGAADAAGTGAGAEEKKEEAAPKKAEVPQLGEEELAVFSQFMSETGHLERSQQVERIIKYRLNPFEVLQCNVEQTQDEIQVSFRKVSLLVHPDKCKHPRAEEAFETCKKALAELQDEDKRKFYVEMMDAARLEAERELKKKKKEEKAKAAASKAKTAKDVAALKNAFLGGGRPNKRKKSEEEEFGTAEVEEELSRADMDKLHEMRRDAANRILQQLEKRRAHAEKVFVANEKRSKEALQKLREEYKKEEKVEEQWDQERQERLDSWRNFTGAGRKLGGLKKPKPHVTEKGVSVLPPTMGGLAKTKEEEDLLGEEGGGGGGAEDLDGAALDDFLDSV